MELIFEFFGKSAITAFTGLTLIGIVALFVSGWFIGGFFYNFLKITNLIRGGKPGLDFSDWVRFAIGIIFLFLSFLFGGFGIIFDFLLVFLTAFGLSLLFKTFKLYAFGAVAILLFLVAFLFISFFWTFTQFTGKTAILEVEVTDFDRSRSGSEITLLVTDVESGDTEEFVVEGDRWGISANVVLLDDWVVFLGGKTYYRVNAIVGLSDTRIDRQKVNESSEPMWEEIEEREGDIPGIRAVYGDLFEKAPVVGRTWTVYIDNDGGMVPEES